MMHTTHPALCKIGGLRRKHEQQIHFSLQYTTKHWIPHLQKFWEVYTKGEQSHTEELTLGLLSDDVLLDRCLSVFDPQNRGRERITVLSSRDPAIFCAVRTGMEGVVVAQIKSDDTTAEFDGLLHQALHLAAENDDADIA